MAYGTGIVEKGPSPRSGGAPDAREYDMNTSVLDPFDVVNTVGRYFQLCDAKDFDGMRALWTDVVTVDYGGIFPLEGRVEADSLKRTMADLVGALPLTQHMVSTAV